MAQKEKYLTLLTVVLWSAAIIFLQSCQRDGKSAEIDPEEIIGQIELPGQEHTGQEARGQDQKNTESDRPPIPDKIDTKLPDFSKYKDVEKKKKAFFNFLRPIVRKENQRVLRERAYVLLQWQHFRQYKELPEEDIYKLKDLAEKYRVEYEYKEGKDFFKDMLMHIDKIPVSLALIQAAKESGWGTSYFARKANNLFGQWCFEQGCGIVPRSRPQGASYELRAFDDVSDSVRVYIQNLNSHPAYDKLRQKRYSMRLAGEEPDAQLMADGLEDYSEMGMQYVETVQQMIRGNKKFMGLHEQDIVS
ncbi:MAG: glucosaminidase domain-containing protein [Desulfovermiculus sp.]